MNIVDTHCHIHSAQYHLSSDDSTRARWRDGGKPDPDDMIAAAKRDDVTKLICVGTDVDDSRTAVDFVKSRDNCWATIGIHPHEAGQYNQGTSKGLPESFTDLATKSKVVAIGECGLDYYYNHSPKEAQQIVLKLQIELAIKHNLPLIFHVRDAFDDFWKILDSFSPDLPLRGVIHSFTDTQETLKKATKRSFFIGLNGIMTFTRDTKQLEMAKLVPIEQLVLETDAPYLTPNPFRGKMCEPKHVRVTAEFLADLRGETLEDFANATTSNSIKLFGL